MKILKIIATIYTLLLPLLLFSWLIDEGIAVIGILLFIKYYYPICLVYLSGIGVFYYYIWKNPDSNQRKKIDDSFMIVLLNFIGMWLYIAHYKNKSQK